MYRLISPGWLLGELFYLQFVGQTLPLSERISSVVFLLPVSVQGTQPRTPNVRGGLKNWQLLLHLKWLLPQYRKHLKGQSDICWRFLLTPLTVLCHRAKSCLLPCCGHGLYQIPISSAGQTTCCVWHSSFIDGLFINCKWGGASFSSLLFTVANPKGGSCNWRPTHTVSAGSSTLDFEWMWHSKK